MGTVAVGRIAREKIVDEVVTLLKEKGGAVAFTYVGVDANEFNSLRRKIREIGGRIVVVKNSLVKIAAEKVGFNDLHQVCSGQTAFAFPGEDTITFSKLLVDFAANYKDTVKILGGVIDEVFLSSEQIEAFSKLPSKEFVYGQVVGAIAAPISGLVGVLSGVLRNLVGVLKAIEDKKQKEN